MRERQQIKTRRGGSRVIEPPKPRKPKTQAAQPQQEKKTDADPS